MLFSDHKIQLHLKDADISYFPSFLNKETSDFYFQDLLQNISWKQDEITIFGKTHLQPRLTALYAENSKPYSYSGITMHPKPFIKSLNEIRKKVELEIKTKFTSCLCNLYRNGSDSNGWHSDNEKSLGPNPIIASVSLGAERNFQLKHKTEKRLKQNLVLNHGSLLIMQGKTQEYWLHQIPKTKKEIGKRINLTFRIIN